MNLPISAEVAQQLGRVGVLFGGTSAERDVSLKSGAAVCQALNDAGVNVIALDLGDNAVEQIIAAKLDRAFIALHGVGGEDGRMQALLEFLKIPYTGSGVEASAIAMDKLRTKQIWRGMPLPTPDFVELSETCDWSATLNELGGEAMVKPAHEGSSIGMSRVASSGELQQAFIDAAKYDSKVLAERLIVGAEYTVAILNGEALPAIKLETDHSFYDYEAKYVTGDTRYLCPCGLTDEREHELRALALQAFNSVGCKTWGRVDFMADQNGRFTLLEVNTVPGMTATSLVPMAAKASGISFEQLVLSVLLATLK
jgi:D-alanine-D-alanine ligase